MVASHKKKHTLTALALSALLVGSTSTALAQEPAPKSDPVSAVQDNASSFFQDAAGPQLTENTHDAPAVKKTPQEAARELDAKRIQELGLKTKVTESPTVLDEDGKPIVPRTEAPAQKQPEQPKSDPKPAPAPTTTAAEQAAPAVAQGTTEAPKPQPTQPAAAQSSPATAPASAGNTPKTVKQQPATSTATTPTKAAPRQGTSGVSAKTPTAAQGVPVNYQATGGTNTKAPTVTSNNKTKAAIVETAKTGLGGTYIWGGKSFKAWDCSGYVSWVLAQHGIKTTAYTFAMKDELRPTSTPEPGDIIFQGGYNHVGIYLGDGMMVSALNPSEGTRIHPVNIMPIDGYYTAL